MFEIGDPDHEGRVVRIYRRSVLVHWATGCTTWHKRHTLAMAYQGMSSKGISFCRCSGAGCDRCQGYGGHGVALSGYSP